MDKELCFLMKTGYAIYIYIDYLNIFQLYYHLMYENTELTVNLTTVTRLHLVLYISKAPLLRTRWKSKSL